MLFYIARSTATQQFCGTVNFQAGEVNVRNHSIKQDLRGPAGMMGTTMAGRLAEGRRFPRPSAAKSLFAVSELTSLGLLTRTKNGASIPRWKGHLIRAALSGIPVPSER
jgi:hypothetical protein